MFFKGDLNLQVRRGVVLTAVQQRGISSSTLLLFAAIVFMVRAVMLMLGPLLVALANDFGTSIAVSGQLAAATFVTFGIPRRWLDLFQIRTAEGRCC